MKEVQSLFLCKNNRRQLIGMSKKFNTVLMVRIEQVERNNKWIKVGNKNNKIFLYIGTFFIMAVCLSVGILVILYFLN